VPFARLKRKSIHLGILIFERLPSKNPDPRHHLQLLLLVHFYSNHLVFASLKKVKEMLSLLCHQTILKFDEAFVDFSVREFI